MSAVAGEPRTHILRALQGAPLPVPPVWLMRQAGRYLPEYLELRSRHDFLEVCHTPELACEVTLQPIRRYAFDAAILFSDILVPLVPMGAELSFGKGHGPRIANPIRCAADVERVRPLDPAADLAPVLEAVRMIRRALPAATSLIGFCGAPFTLACYWIEGGKPEPFARIKQMMYHEPAAFARLQERLADSAIATLRAQAEAGAEAVQLFDTWAGVLPAQEFREFLLPTLQRVFAALRESGLPCTYFTRNSSHLLAEIRETGCTVTGIDWRCPLGVARAALGEHAVLQGNLDPTVLLADEARIRAETRRVLAEARGPHVFNLGHGILPMTPPHAVEILLDEIRGGSR